MTSSPMVAVFNTSEDTTELLRLTLEHHGFSVVSAMTHDLRDGKMDLEHLMTQYQPAVIVYDIALPYDVNWRFFEHIRDSRACKGVRFVLTTTNVKQVREVAGESPQLLEIVGKPYDLSEVVRRVRDAADRGDRGRSLTQ